MLFYQGMSPDRRRLLHALFIPSLVSLLFVLSFVLEKGMDWDFSTLGVLPRKIEGLPGILLHPFVHGGFSHLANNLPTFFVLSLALYYFYRAVANRVMVIIWFGTGILLWIIGRDSYHIGASGVIYGLAFFIFWGGLLMHSISLMAISLAIVFWYGSMVWDMFPFLPNESVSWEGHLSGALAGSLAAAIFRKAGIPPANDQNNENDDENEADDELTQMAMKYDREADEPKAD
jgi:membrane associated rhomboid family serine protease